MSESRYKPTREQHYKTIDERCAQNITKLKFAELGKGMHLIVRTAKIRQQIADAFLAERTVEEIAIAERIARYLDNEIEYDIPTTYNF